MEPWERRFTIVAARQEALIARFQLPDLGYDSDAWRRAIRSRRWEPVSDRVLRSCASQASHGQRVLAAVLDASPGAILHGPSSLGWLGMRGFRLVDLHVARVRGISGNRTRLATLHELRAIRSHDVVVAHGVPCETALRAIWSQAAQYSPERLFEIGLEKIGKMLDQAHRLDLVTWAGLHEMVEDIQQRGRSGTVLMRTLAADRPPGSSPTESLNETQFEKILQQGNRRGLRRQVVVGGHEPIGRGDHRDDELPLVFETNSKRFHTTPTDQAADERRYQLMNNAGFMVAVIWEDDLWSNRPGVLATVDEARRLASRGERGVVHSPSCPWPDPYRGSLAEHP
jgi:very-short-patch-repair endonuclease